MLFQIIVDVGPAAREVLSSWEKRVSPGIKTEAAISETDPPAETKPDHVFIKSGKEYFLERGDGTTIFASGAHRFERSEAERIIAQDRDLYPELRTEEIPVAPRADADDFVLIKSVAKGEYWRESGGGMTKDIAGAHRYSRRDAESHAKVLKNTIKIVEIAPAATGPWQDRYVEICKRNIRLHGRIAELERENSKLTAANESLTESCNNLIVASIQHLAA